MMDIHAKFWTLIFASAVFFLIAAIVAGCGRRQGRKL